VLRIATKNNGFFRGPRVNFPSNFVKIGCVNFAYDNPANKQTSKLTDIDKT